MDGRGGERLFARIAGVVAGTRVESGRGIVAVEEVRAGDRLRSAGGHMVRVLWCAHRVFDRAAAQRDCIAPIRIAPVRIAAGALGDGLPDRPVQLGPDQPVATAQGAVAAGHLVDGRLITREAAGPVAYVTFGTRAPVLVAGMACPAARHPTCARAAGAARQAMAGGRRLPPLRGQLEAVSPGRVIGYAGDGTGPVALEVVIDGAPAAWGMADRPRPDLAMAGGAAAALAFDIAVDLPHRGGLIEVRRAADGAMLAGSPVLLSPGGGGSLAAALPALSALSAPPAQGAAGLEAAMAVLRGIDGAILTAGLHGPFGTAINKAEMRG